MEPRNGGEKTAFRADLLSVRTLFIFAAGFALALLLARSLPGAELFHPEARIRTKDIVIALTNGRDLSLRGFVTTEHEDFTGGSSAWDSDLLREVLAQRQTTLGPINFPVRATYVEWQGNKYLLSVERRR